MTADQIKELQTLLPQAMLPDWARLGARAIRLVRDRHHPDQHAALYDRLLTQLRASVALRQQRQLTVPRPTYPPDLPITARKDDLVTAIRNHQVIIIAGETGSGKTTQLPKMCLEAGLGIAAKIGCTQPRRVAAQSISRRLAEELNVTWGREVGCKIRFDDRSSPQTYIKLMTDGILLAETQGDPDLSEYNALIIDEAHERSLNIDFLLGHLKGLLARRRDLKLLVTSATIDTAAFSRHFDNAPIFEVSGRMFPVEVIHQPLADASDESGDVSYVDAAVQTAERLLYETNDGDLLIFMPGERDIRETTDQLDGRFHGEAEVIPLFGRLSAGDQQRVFAPAHRRKIVIATNIAETSLTIPGIRYVIDTGLARISRYNPRTRTRRLPIEPISQSSANQRAGRAGRVQAGVCIRLYSAEDFQSRPPFTQPEIQRANLAEVILRMLAFRLGDIETFPFVQPPTPAAIAGGYALLQELGALDASRALTPLGAQLARLPIDPTLGRMLLQSQHEHATRELLIIAAGLSIQDPRERPLDQREAAAAAHRRFSDPRSDFLALLNIWNAIHDQWENLRTQNQRRKFCKQHFLSYLRMREWQDLHAQLHDALADLGTLQLNASNAAYEAIHRSILSGMTGHVAHREDRNTYKGSANRLLTVFPGSALAERSERPVKTRSHPASQRPATPASSSQPEWIVAGEIVETSQLFARTLAGIDPHWIYQVAPHCCKLTHQNPHWSASAGRVLVDEVVTLHGLEVQRRKVAYGNLDPKDATAIFIRSALVEEDLQSPRARAQQPNDDDDAPANSDRPDLRVLTPAPHDSAERFPQYRFLAHNRAIRHKIENWQTRVRRYDLADPDQALAEFYARHLENVSSLHDLNRVLRDHPEPGFLCVTEAELAGSQSLDFDPQAFPDAVPISGQPLAISYAYAPGEDHDGVTIRLPFTLAQSVSASALEWAVPGLREEKINELLRALPKTIRRDLMPLPPKAAEIARDLQPSGPSFLGDLARFLRQRYGVAVNPADWPADALPPHIRPRLEIIGHDRKLLAAGRDLAQLQQGLEKVRVAPTREPADWERATRQWERFGLTAWTFPDPPPRITVSEGNGLTVYAWPGLEHAEDTVNLRLFRTEDAARNASLPGVQRLVELHLQKEIAWLEKDLRALAACAPLYAPLGPLAELQASALTHLKHHLISAEPLPALTQVEFQKAVAEAQRRLPGLATQLIDHTTALLKLRQQVQQRVGSPAPSAPAPPRPQKLSSLTQLLAPAPARPANPFASELAALLPPRFLEHIPFLRLPHLQRYLKALQLRAERAALNPLKDQERARQVAPYAAALQQLQNQASRSPATRREFEELRWMIEEYKVSVFAQELGTAVPVSPKRLEQQLQRLRDTLA